VYRPMTKGVLVFDGQDQSLTRQVREKTHILLSDMYMKLNLAELISNNMNNDHVLHTYTTYTASSANSRAMNCR
jgi:hypothetical protein